MMTNSKDQELIYKPPQEKTGELINTGIAVKFRRGPMDGKEQQRLKEMYEKRGWKLDMDTHLLSFVSACGRWFDTYNKDNSQFCRINGDWIVSLVVSKDVEQEKVLPKEM